MPTVVEEEINSGTTCQVEAEKKIKLKGRWLVFKTDPEAAPGVPGEHKSTQ